MAISRCPECNGMVSEYATNCPHCGFRMSLAKNSGYQLKNSMDKVKNSGDPEATKAANDLMNALRAGGFKF